MKAIILCAPGLEECEAMITRDFLYRAGIDVKLAGQEKQITSAREFTFITDCLIDEIKDELYDCLILPGGVPGVNNLEDNPNVQYMIDNHIKNDKYVAAICAAPKILIHKGLLEDDEFICHPGHESGKKPKENVKAYTWNKFITGKAFGAGFEFAYEIVKNLLGKEKADATMASVHF